jgi:hypothetical protein
MAISTKELHQYNEMLMSGEAGGINDLARKLNIAKSTLKSRLDAAGLRYNVDAKVIDIIDEAKFNRSHASVTIGAKKNPVEKSETKAENTPGIKKLDLDIAKELEALKQRVNVLELALKDNNNKANINISDSFDETFLYRTVKLYTNIATEYDDFCNKHKHISKQDILNQALLEFINKYK